MLENDKVKAGANLTFSYISIRRVIVIVIVTRFFFGHRPRGISCNEVG